MKAIQVLKPTHAAVVDNLPLPKLPSPAWVRIKTVAVALNPSDYLHIRHEHGPCIAGCDFSGVVDEVGTGVTSGLKKGDRVWGRDGNNQFNQLSSSRLN